MARWEDERRTEYIFMKISPSLKEAAKKRAASEGRSLSNYIENLIKKDVEKS